MKSSAKVSENFSIYEFFPKTFMDVPTMECPINLLLEFIDPKIIDLAQRFRSMYGTIHINTWMWGSPIEYRGWRPADCPVGAVYSPHKAGKAVDLVFSGTIADQVIAETMAIKSSVNYTYGLTRMKKNSDSGIHVDVYKSPNGLVLL